MSRFNSEAYDKLYPRVLAPVKAPETAVPSFTPTQDILEGTDPDSTPEPPEVPDQAEVIPEVPDQMEVNIDGDGQLS